MNVNFHWKGPILSMNYFERVFQELWPYLKEQILYRTLVLQHIHFWAKFPMTTWGTFLFLKFVCIWFLILLTRIQYFKESRVVVTTESFSIELNESIVHTCSEKRYFRNIGGSYALFNHDLNCSCLVLMFSLRFSGSKVLINLRRQFRIRKIFRAQFFVGFAVFPFCV